jgi:hypothetical protein
MKTISKILKGIGTAFHALIAIYATEENNSIPFHACNTTWGQKTELAATVFYKDQEEGDTFSLILDGVSAENSCPEQSKFLKKGNITSISLILQNYYEGGRDIAGTVLAQSTFNPRPLGLKEIKFEIRKRKIIPSPKYGNLPSKFEATK